MLKVGAAPFPNEVNGNSLLVFSRFEREENKNKQLGEKFVDLAPWDLDSPLVQGKPRPQDTSIDRIGRLKVRTPIRSVNQARR